ncbi:MAG: Uma2 family endonuclease [Kofleriaceae bacterium]|nr:Uma2 family endonuclease [Kofleriaceae bacterium]
MSSPHDPASTDAPAVDDHLLTGEHRYELDDGKLVYVPPAEEPHAVSHGALGALLWAHRAADRSVAIDMLTRVSELSERAPDAAIYPTARDEQTGGRQLEELAFEIVSTESLGQAARKATQLSQRGVRRVFALDIVRQRALEWSAPLETWSMLASNVAIEDPALAVPLPIRALVDAAHAEAAMVRAFRERRHPEFVAEREEGREEGQAQTSRAILTKLLLQKFGPLSPADLQRIATAELAQLERYLERVLTSATVAQVLAD